MMLDAAAGEVTGVNITNQGVPAQGQNYNPIITLVGVGNVVAFIS